MQRDTRFWILLAVLAGFARAGGVGFAQAPGTDAGYVIVKSTTANVMSGSAVLDQVREGQRIAFTQRNGDWFLVQLPGDGQGRQGWIHRADVVVETPARQVAEERPRPTESWLYKRVMMTHRRPQLRRLNETTGQTEVIGEVREADVRVDKVQGDWLWVRTANQEGWISWSDAVPMEDALAYFTQRIEQNANDGFAYNARGIYRTKHGDLDNALADLNEAVRLAPDAAVIHNRGCLWQTKKEFSNALADFSEALRLDPNHYWTYYHRGQLYQAQKDTDRAIADFTEAIRILPGFAVAYAERGWAWLSKHEYDLALADFNDSIRFDPKLAASYRGRGLIHRSRKEYPQALADFEESLRLFPDSASTYTARGQTWLDQKQYDRAVADFTEALRLDPKVDAAYQGRGRCYQARKQYDLALADFNALAGLLPDSAAPLYERGSLWLDERRYDQALADYTEALRFEGNSAYAHDYRGRAYHGLKRYVEALAEFNEALRLDPRRVSAYLQRARTYRATQQYDQAIADCNEAMRLEPRNAAVLAARGYTWFLSQDYDKALQDLDSGERLDPRNGWVYYHRAMLLATCPDDRYRDGARAREQLRKAQLYVPAGPDLYEAEAAVAAENGDFDEAVRRQQAVLDDPAKRDDPEMSARLALYRQHQPYRQGTATPLTTAHLVNRPPLPPPPERTTPAPEPETLRAVEIAGQISRLDGATLTITSESEFEPAVGDLVEVYVEVEGVGKAVIATAKVTQVGPRETRAMIEKATGRVAAGQRTNIRAPHPTRRAIVR